MMNKAVEWFLAYLGGLIVMLMLLAGVMIPVVIGSAILHFAGYLP